MSDPRSRRVEPETVSFAVGEVVQIPMLVPLSKRVVDPERITVDPEDTQRAIAFAVQEPETPTESVVQIQRELVLSHLRISLVLQAVPPGV